MSGTVYELHGLPLHLGWCMPEDGFAPLQSKRWELLHGPVDALREKGAEE